MKLKIILNVTFIITLLIGTLLIGVTIGYMIGTNSTADDPQSEENVYKTSCTIYVSTSTSNSPGISSSDLSSQLPQSVLQLDNIYSAIAEAYPAAQYDLTLEQTEGIVLLRLTATSEDRENLAAICNMAAELLCEEIESAIDQASCTIADYAKQPKPSDCNG